MALPIQRLVEPSVLNGQSNGQLPAALLTTITMPGGGTAVVLAQCAPKWQALLAAAARDGIRLSATQGYRTLAQQIALLKARYVVVSYTADIWWDGCWWEHRTGAVVATPGRSNHGKGLAIDLCMAGGASLTAAAVAWLCAHAHEYGISAELQSENWHWRVYDGDAVTPAVRAHILSQRPSTVEEDDMTPFYATTPDGTVYEVAPGFPVRALTLDEWRARQQIYPHAAKPLHMPVQPADLGTIDARLGALEATVAALAAKVEAATAGTPQEPTSSAWPVGGTFSLIFQPDAENNG